jgi:transcriptional regulator with XRE-family HTH domain
MSIRTGFKERARRRAHGQVVTAGHDLRQARELAGLSRHDVSTATGLSESAVYRLELGQLQEITVERLALVAAAVGLEPAIRLYPGGSPLRDVAHLALLERLRLRLHSSLVWQAEVPLDLPGDLRSWDAVVTKHPSWRPVEAETRLGDVQALERRVHLKMRDAGADHVILLVAETRNNRVALRAASDAWHAAFPIGTRATLAALAAGRLPEASALIVL